MLWNLLEMFDDAMNGTNFVVVLLVWIPIQSLLVVVVHEGGHMLAALARRQPGVEVRIGGGQSVVLESRLRGVRLRLANPGFLRAGANQVRWSAERTTILDLLIIALAGPAASFLGGVACLWLAYRSNWTSGLHDFLTLAGFNLIAFGCVLNLIPFTLSEGTRRRPGVAVRTDGQLILEALRLVASLRTQARR